MHEENIMSLDVFKNTNVCAGVNPSDTEVLEEAAIKLLDANNIIIKISEKLGDAASWAGGHVSELVEEKIGIDVSKKIQSAIEELLWNFQSGANGTLDEDGAGDRWGWLHKSLGVISGATGGFVGLPGLLWDIPVTTGVIMRSVADIARSFPEENINRDDTKRACIEVFALGSPLESDDEADAGYWAARVGLSHATVAMTIKTVASRFGIVLSEKFLAQAVPVAGAFAGAALNYAFIDYYQEMARVHFMIRGVERRALDPSSVRPCFSKVVEAVRERRRRATT